MRLRRVAAGLSIRELARRAHIDPGHLSRIESGTRPATPEIAAAVDQALEAGGQLAALAAQPPRRTGPDPAPLGEADVATIRDTITRLVATDTYGTGGALHRHAARAYRRYAGRLAVGRIEHASETDLQATVAELAEVAGWLAYDADCQPAARRMLTEAVLAAQLAGDRGMEVFATDLLAMQALHLGQPREALRLADRVYALGGRSCRVAAISLLRRGRALAELGARGEALAALAAARSVFAQGPGVDDPPWTWWVHEQEMQLHEARAWTALGEHARAVDLSRRAVDGLQDRQVRDRVIYRAYHLDDLVRAGAWREVEALLADGLGPGVVATASPRGFALVRSALEHGREGVAPTRVRDAGRALLCTPDGN